MKERARERTSERERAEARGSSEQVYAREREHKAKKNKRWHGLPDRRTKCLATNRIFLRRRKENFYCILQSKRLKDERILENYSRESGSQKGLGLNPKRMILNIISSFIRFECRML